MRVNDVVFKNGKIKSDKHFMTYSNYIEKDDAEIIKQVSDDEMLEMIKLNIERLNQKKGKRGKPPRGFQSMVFSPPKEIDEMVRSMTLDEKSDLINSFMETIYRDIEKLNEPKKLDMAWLKKHTKIVFHGDSKHAHFHVLLPKFAFVKSGIINILGKDGKNKKEFVTLDYANMIVSKNARHKMFNVFNSMLNQVKPMTKEEFDKEMYDERGKKIELVTSGKMPRFQNGMKGKKAKVVKELEKPFKEMLYQLDDMSDIMEDMKAAGLNQEQKDMYYVFKKKESRVRQQFQNGNTERGKKTFTQVMSDFKKITPS